MEALSSKSELENEDKDKGIAYMKLLVLDSVDRNIINRDNFEFYFNKLLETKGTEVRSDVFDKRNS